MKNTNIVLDDSENMLLNLILMIPSVVAEKKL